MFYDNIEYGDDKDNPGSNYELENTINGMKYEGETGQPLREYIHRNYVIGKGCGRGEKTGGIAWALKTFGHEVFIARRTFRESDGHQRLIKEAKEIIEKDTIMNGYNRKARGGGVSEHHPSTKELIGKYNKIAWESKSREEKDEIIRKQLETKSKRTPEELVDIKRKEAEGIAKRTPEEKAESNRKRLETNDNKSPEEKTEINSKLAETWFRKSPEEKEEINRKIIETKVNKSPEEKAEISRKMSEQKKLYWSNKRAAKLLLEQQKKDLENPLGGFSSLV
jgi:hypothetical protein